MGSTPRNRVLAGPERHGHQARRRVVVATSVAESALTVPACGSSSIRACPGCPISTPAAEWAGSRPCGCPRHPAISVPGVRRARLPGRYGAAAQRRNGRRSPPTPRPRSSPQTSRGRRWTSRCGGRPAGQGLPLPTPLPELPLRAATRTLHGLGALESPDPAARATAFGRALATVPADPRIARGLLLGGTCDRDARQAAECAALLSLDVRADGGDLTALLRRARNSHDAAPAGWRREVQRLERIARAQRGHNAAGHTRELSVYGRDRPRLATSASCSPCRDRT